MSKEPKEKPFEHILTELETIVAELDNPQGLEESLDKFKRGMELADLAEKRLAVIENKFHKIKRDMTSPKQLEDTTLPDETAVKADLSDF
jgi:exodeoxyribonuclease VII small subunit